jgi:hypothetical protein
MAKQLLIEQSLFHSREVINESKRGGGNMIVIGQVQACDKPNANRRIYPYEILYSQVEKYIAGPIAERRATGELDHPESSIINLKNVCHNIKRLWWEGKDLYGEIEVLPTPSGNILRQLFENNITVGISSRALGSTTPIGEGLVQVEDDLDLICWDFVSQPSTYGAYMKPANSMGLRESVDLSKPFTPPYSRANKIMDDLRCELSGVCCIR